MNRTERKLLPEVEAKYKLVNLLPGKIVVWQKEYDFTKMTLKEADAFHERQKGTKVNLLIEK
jgi:hypothetical protein